MSIYAPTGKVELVEFECSSFLFTPLFLSSRS